MTEKRHAEWFNTGGGASCATVTAYSNWVKNLPGRLVAITTLGNWHIAITVIEDEPKGGSDAQNDSRPSGTYLSSS